MAAISAASSVSLMSASAASMAVRSGSSVSLALHGFGSAGILEIVEDWRGNAYRAVYTVRFSAAVFVLHVFQKKAKHGIATPGQDMELIRERLKVAEQMAKELAG